MMLKKNCAICLLITVLIISVVFMIGFFSTPVYASSITEASTKDMSFEMIEKEKNSMKFVRTGVGLMSEVFSYTKDGERDVLKIHNVSTKWTNDSALIDGYQFGDIIVETTFRQDTSDSSKDGFPLIVLRRENPSANYSQVGSGISTGFLGNGNEYVI